MGSLRILLLLGCASFIFAHDSMSDHLDEKLRQTRIEIAKLYFREEPPVERKLYKIKWEQLWKEELDKGRPFIANTFDKILLIQGNRFVSFFSDIYSSNRTLPQEITSIVNSGSIKFVRSIVWKSVLYLLICYGTNSCSVYTGTDNLQLKFRQKIQQKGCPMDASFFVHANRLYLVVVPNSGSYVVPSFVYHWRGTYMDVVAESMTIAAVSVTTFKHKQSTIILFAQNNGIGSMLYEFKETSLSRIQFLPSSNPISVYHYTYADYNFILLINERGPSSLLWWDGYELLDWQQIPEIEGPKLVHVASVNDDTFFFVGYDDILQIYKFGNASSCILIGTMKLPNEVAVIEVQTHVDESTIIMVLVTMNADQTYNIESWELLIEEIPSEHSIKESNVLSKHLAELVEILQRRKPLVEKAKASWSFLPPVNEDLTTSKLLVVPNLEMVAGTVNNINILEGEDVMAPHELEEQLKNVIPQVDDTLAKSKQLFTSSNIKSLNGNIVVEGDAFVEQMQIDKMQVDYFNDVNMRLNNVSDLNGTHEFSTTLKAKNIVINDLKVNTICGIPFQYWSLKNNTSKMQINLEANEIGFVNDTVRFYSNLSLTNLNVKALNGINIDELYNDLFLINRNQRIKGNVIYNNSLQILNLTVRTLNGKPWNDHMNAKTNQTFDDFVIKKLRVENLYADTINGVPVSEAARISTENVIKGEVRIAKLHVTDNFTVESNFSLAKSRSHQIYADITVHGNLKIGTLDIDKYAKIILDDDEIKLNDILATFWTKSTNQVIKSDIVFENDLIIDHLKAQYLNGFSDDQFLYTTATTIPKEFKNLHFENVHIDNMPFVEGRNSGIFEIAPESLTIRERLHLTHLHASQLFTSVYNDLLVADILSGKHPHIFPRNTSFITIKTEQLNVGDFNFLFFNGKGSVNLLEDARNVSKDQGMKLMQTLEFHVENLNVERINDLELKKLLLLKNIKMSDLKNLVIFGDLTIKNNLKVDRIDDQPSKTYLRNVSDKDIVVHARTMIDELIVENVTLKSLYGHDVNNLFDSFFSKSREQIVPGNFSFYKVTTENIATRIINNRNISKLMWIDESLVLTGDVTFEDLFVEGDVITRTLNHRNISELYDSLLNVSVTEIADLRVYGNASWDVPLTNRTSLTFLFENAVTKATNQTILGDIIFQKNVSASTVSGEWRGIKDIRNIIADTVIDDEDIEIVGRKIFKEDLDIDTLSVTGDIHIPTINNIDILKFNDSAIRKHRNETITGSITFLEGVAINQIFVNDNSHSVPLKDAALATDVLPSDVIFKDLIVLEDVYLKSLDGIDFDKFVENRITINGDHEIFADVQFNGVIEVLGNASVQRINGIDPSDLVLNDTEETQVISGSKIFEQDVIVNGNIYASFINGINISSEYSNGIQNDEDVEIFGDLVFETTVKVPQNVSVSNMVNGINFHAILDDLEEESHRTHQMFARNKTAMEGSILQSFMISNTLKNIFSYLEAEEILKIEAPNVKKVDVVYYKQIVKLNMFGEEPGPLCGLPSNCSCPAEYVAELDEEGCHIRRMNGTRVIRNYHELHDMFGVNVITNAVSYSRECTSSNTKEEFTTISWMNFGMVGDGDSLAHVTESSLKIRGFIRDAEVFMTGDNAVFVVLAVYYDILLATHRTSSVIYKIDFENNVLSLHQELPTDGAWAIEIFKTNSRDLYLLLGCFGESQKSSLYKLDAVTSKFIIIRDFGGKTRNVKSLFQEEDRFVLLDDFDTNAINIFHYDSEIDNFYSYQSLFHDSRINGLECFYADEFGRSDSFIVVTTQNDQFYIYEYMYAQKFQLKIHHRTDDLQTMVPFYYLGNYYIFTGTSTNSTIMRIIKQGPH
ncbi:uncharacterized protein LOC143423799 [Xylocopa sonorina]|uniref:uncharacterized protein LOC143423799 n=1 Tax=Xylocopa sonorina TaxID=1818115 RepID=UPI00403B2E23